MITLPHLTDFKNFADETLHLGPFTIIVGANASGKSNLGDAFRYLHGTGRGCILSEIFGGRYGAGGQVERPPIRGQASEQVRFGRDPFALRVSLDLDGRQSLGWKLHTRIDRIL